jgi:hypothetical protein
MKERSRFMSNTPYTVPGETAQAAYHVIPDLIKGGWNVYTTAQPQEPQQHFASQEAAVAYAEQRSKQEGVSFVVEENEAPEVGR